MTELRVERIGGFKVLDSLHGASGSQGTLYRAVCEVPPFPGINPGDVVALKTMSVVDEDGSQFRRLKKRTDALAAIDHPNVVRYRGCFSLVDAFNSVHVVVMECLEGETLKDRLRDNPEGLDVDEVMRIANGIVAALVETSDAGIVHRDIKPSNVFLCRDGGVKLIDFEIARQEDGTISTGVGRFFGTFDYMAPEFSDVSFRGDVTSDVFSAGVVIHEALSGRTPYAVSDRNSVRGDFDFISRWSGGGESPLRMSARSVRLLSGMKEVLVSALSTDRKRRYRDFQMFAEALAQVRFRELVNGSSRYRLLRVVGKGGFGEVFKARISGTGRLVAIKHLLKSDYGDRFRRESRIMQRFREPCFTQFIDYFETGAAGTREAFLVMEFLPGMPGSSLRDAIKRHRNMPLPGSDVLKAFRRYAHGLSVMHKQGVFHRDIKPANLYYPEGHPEGAVIMDMGIVRDTGGTATQGQVPGTLDYMPPEIVTVGGRGDAGMDIYALGLCLYEALTGKMGYERLPSGTAAFGAFYSRAQSLVPPRFDDPEIVCRPSVLDLLCRMTAPDRRKRLSDASAVERILAGISWDGAASRKTDPVRVQRVDGRSADIDASRTRRPLPDDPPTVDTAPTGGREPQHPQRDSARAESIHEIVIFSLKAACAVGVLLVGWLAWPYVLKGWDSVKDRAQTYLEERREAEARRIADQKERERRKTAEEARRRKEREEQAAKERAMREALDRQRKAAEKIAADTDAALAEAYMVEGMYLNAANAAAPDSKRDAWIRKWRNKDVKLAPGAIDKCLGILDQARDSCERRAAEERQEAALREEKKRKVASDIKSARQESALIVAGFADRSKSLEAMNSRMAEWRNTWSSLSGEGAFAVIEDELISARKKRIDEENERQVMAECMRLIDNVWICTVENVRNWRGYLSRAEIEIKKALGAGRLTDKSAESVRREIAKVGKWIVGVVDNRSHCNLEFLGRRIPSVDHAPANRVTFVLTNGIPNGAAITASGYEPIAVRAERFDGTTLRIMPRDLRKVQGNSELVVPPLEEGVLCFIDGVPYGSGIAMVRSGRHELVYRNAALGHDGIKRYSDQMTIIESVEGQRLSVAPPGNWTESVEFKSAERDAAAVKAGRKILEKCGRMLELMPLETRRERLENVWRFINDTRVAPLIGDKGMKELRSRYDAERRKVVGYVENGTDRLMHVHTDSGEVEIPPFGNRLLVYENGIPPSAEVRVDGYDPIKVSSLKEFPNGTANITEDILLPSPVDVVVQPIKGDVDLRISGEKVSGNIKLKPGRYVCVYSRKGFLDQRFPIEIKIGEPLELPLPGTWVESGVFGQIMDTVRDMSDSTSRGVKTAVDTVSVIETKKHGDD